MTTCNIGTCDCENTLDRTLTSKRSKAEIELPKLLRQQPEQVSNQETTTTTQDTKNNDYENAASIALSSKLNPRKNRLRLKTSQRRTQKIWEKLVRKRQINDIPANQYATWAILYTYRYNKQEVRTQ